MSLLPLYPLKLLATCFYTNKTNFILCNEVTFQHVIYFQDVTTQLWATLYDYPCLKACKGLRDYIENCVRVSWGLVNQVRINKCTSKDVIVTRFARYPALLCGFAYAA